MTPLILIGAGGFGLEVATYAQDCLAAGTASFDLKGFLDDTKPVGTLHHGLPVLGGTTTTLDPDAQYLIALGSPEHRRSLHIKLRTQGARFATLTHPRAYVAATAQIGQGCILAPFSFAGPYSRLGEQSLLNIYASVAHESTIGAYCALSPYAGTQAASTLGEAVFMGAHATVTKNVHVGNNVKLAAGSVVYNDIPDGASAMGNPARFKPALSTDESRSR